MAAGARRDTGDLGSRPVSEIWIASMGINATLMGTGRGATL